MSTKRFPWKSFRRASLALLVLGAGAGCEDIRRFEGSWAGPVSADPALAHGFAPGAVLRGEVAEVSRVEIRMSLVLPDGAEGVPFEPIRRAAADALGDLRLGGDALRTYLGFARPADGAAAVVAVSLLAEDRIAVRVIRGPDDAYGVFSLERVR